MGVLKNWQQFHDSVACEVRETQYPNIKASIYLDAAAAPVYPQYIIENYAELLKNGLYSNPHSQFGSQSSSDTKNKINAVRNLILEKFDTNAHEYSIIFTHNTTASLKLVGEMLDLRTFTPNQRLVCHKNSHNSVLGLREMLPCFEKQYICASEADFENIVRSCPRKSLIAFPAQCNATGVCFPLEKVHWIHENQSFSLLDAAAYLSNGASGISLRKTLADFVAFSFYKLFGFPTGLGALMVRNRIAGELKKRYYFGGGTVAAVAVYSPVVAFQQSLHQRYEDGTLPYLEILAIPLGYEFLETFYGSQKQMEIYLCGLGQYLYDILQNISVESKPLVKLHTRRPSCAEASCSKEQASIITFSVYNVNGSGFISHVEVGKIAREDGVHLRVGSFCNMGAAYDICGFTDEDIVKSIGHCTVACWDAARVEGKPITGTVRVSLGLYNTKKDCNAFAAWLRARFGCRAQSLKRILPSARNVKASMEQIWIYPVKSWGGWQIPADCSWPVLSAGLLADRAFAVFCGERKISIKEVPEFSQAQCFVEPSSSSKDDFDVFFCWPSLSESRQLLAENILTEFKPCISKASEMLRVHFSETWRLQVSEMSKSFSNESSFLLINLASVRRLLEIHSSFNLGPATDFQTLVDTFRPNFVVDLGIPWVEDAISSVDFGTFELQKSSDCTRCDSITINPRTGIANQSWLYSALNTVRKERFLQSTVDTNFVFGVHLYLSKTADDASLLLRVSSDLTVNFM